MRKLKKMQHLIKHNFALILSSLCLLHYFVIPVICNFLPIQCARVSSSWGESLGVNLNHCIAQHIILTIGNNVNKLRNLLKRRAFN